jgi:hypothetical protein
MRADGVVDGGLGLQCGATVIDGMIDIGSYAVSGVRVPLCSFRPSAPVCRSCSTSFWLHVLDISTPHFDSYAKALQYRCIDLTRLLYRLRCGTPSARGGHPLWFIRSSRTELD